MFLLVTMGKENSVVRETVSNVETQVTDYRQRCEEFRQAFLEFDRVTDWGSIATLAVAQPSNWTYILIEFRCHVHGLLLSGLTGQILWELLKRAYYRWEGTGGTDLTRSWEAWGKSIPPGVDAFKILGKLREVTTLSSV